jgi:hypothetical protein
MLQALARGESEVGRLAIRLRFLPRERLQHLANMAAGPPRPGATRADH